MLTNSSGNLTLSVPETYTGGTFVRSGTLTFDSNSSLANGGDINVTGGGTLDIFGTVTMAPDKSFGVGSGISGTTGTVIVETGGVLNIGSGLGYVAIGGDFINAADTGRIGQQGQGVLDIEGGTVNVGAAGNGGNGPSGMDNSHLWFNPYGGAGSGSTINLDGGLFSTARPMQNGSGYTATFNFNGGTLQVAGGNDPGGVGNFLAVSVANVRNGGAIIDTNGFNVTINQVACPLDDRRRQRHRRRLDENRRRHADDRRPRNLHRRYQRQRRHSSSQSGGQQRQWHDPSE